jgi:hypothetical protein
LRESVARLCEGRRVELLVLDEIDHGGSKIVTAGALIFWWSMIFSENRFPLFRIML